jgi:hypothetical protein
MTKTLRNGGGTCGSGRRTRRWREWSGRHRVRGGRRLRGRGWPGGQRWRRAGRLESQITTKTLWSACRALVAGTRRAWCSRQTLGGGRGIGKMAQRPCGMGPDGTGPGAGRGIGEGDAGGTTLTLAASRLDPRVKRPRACLSRKCGRGKGRQSTTKTLWSACRAAVLGRARRNCGGAMEAAVGPESAKWCEDPMEPGAVPSGDPEGRCGRLDPYPCRSAPLPRARCRMAKHDNDPMNPRTAWCPWDGSNLTRDPHGPQ